MGPIGGTIAARRLTLTKMESLDENSFGDRIWFGSDIRGALAPRLQSELRLHPVVRRRGVIPPEQYSVVERILSAEALLTAEALPIAEALPNHRDDDSLLRHYLSPKGKRRAQRVGSVKHVS